MNSQADNFDDDQEATAEGIADIEAGRRPSKPDRPEKPGTGVGGDDGGGIIQG